MRLGFIILLILTVFYSPLKAQGDYVGINAGGSMLYGDNAGVYSELKFKILPTFSFTYNKQLNDYFSLRTNLGAQFLNSGDFKSSYMPTLKVWGDLDQAFAFKGTPYFLDLMPTVVTNPNSAGMVEQLVNFYIGLGMGIIYVDRVQSVHKNVTFQDDQWVEGEIITFNQSDIVPYIPLRTGVKTDQNDNWDFGLELSLLTMLNSKVDGNTYKSKTLTPDMMFQFQLMLIYNIGRAW